MILPNNDNGTLLAAWRGGKLNLYTYCTYILTLTMCLSAQVVRLVQFVFTPLFSDQSIRQDMLKHRVSIQNYDVLQGMKESGRDKRAKREL